MLDPRAESSESVSAARRYPATNERTKLRRWRACSSTFDKVIEIPCRHHHIDRMPDQVDRSAGQADRGYRGIVRKMRLDEAGSVRIGEPRVRIGVYIEDVFPLQVVNLAIIREDTVKEQKAQIRNPGFW